VESARLLISGANQMRKMDQCESWVNEYLTFQGFKDIVFEPDGNVPPDFLVNGRIAIEVRRLNRHCKAKSGQPKGLEELAMPRRKWLQSILEALGPIENGGSWYVTYVFKRPELTNNWAAVVREKLQPFQSAITKGEEPVQVVIDSNFRLTLIRAREPSRSGFILVGYFDRNAGGPVIPELEKNLNICIEEKTRKIAPYRSKHPEWWLALVDFVNGGTREPIHIKHDWDKVLVLHPSNYEGAYEIKSPA
jgi:hypothetical protein